MQYFNIFDYLVHSKAKDQAENALLAEYTLPKLDGLCKQQLVEQLEFILRAAGLPSVTQRNIRTTFNNYSRLQQLNLVALALQDLDIAPALDNEVWNNIRDPLHQAPCGHDALKRVHTRIEAKHGKRIRIGATPLSMSEMS
ncbi:hypothetical protein [Echinimonas agarilytica]|uniref:Uncharacterized protein n=1 Tax=Echinimonas agarilytica TaxID=1215918 RepID=A0AA42B8Q0_9GAMM|nr:hypothetical protein [Echinimonas agarilytica]MCM2681234.1 hypothetical protein [Echinimonas agarilytica]